MDKYIETIELGTIQVDGELHISDPCYRTNIWCAENVKLKPGTYHCFADIYDCGDWGTRIGKLYIKHESVKTYSKEDFLVLELVSFVGVDSGQCGIFDKEYYEKYHNRETKEGDSLNTFWYDKVCKITLEKPMAGTVDGKGVVSESGYGDGSYDVWKASYKNEWVYLEITYIEDEPEDEWYEESDEEEV